jgi:hypothetical protein
MNEAIAPQADRDDAFGPDPTPTPFPSCQIVMARDELLMPDEAF